MKRRYGISSLKSIVSLLSAGVLLAAVASAQNMVDKTVATVSDGVRTELITYSDLKWQLALQPGVSLSPLRSEDLNGALTILVNQRIFALEAERMPRPAPTDAEIEAEIKRVLDRFATTADFVRRLQAVGFDSIKDDNFQRMIGKRVAIEKYIDFRFRSFIVNTPEEEGRYFNNVWAPEFRSKFQGLLMPTLEEKRSEIDKLLTESKVLTDIEAFLDDAKRRVEIVVLKSV